MTRAIVTAFHKYQPYGENYYEPILDYFISNMKKYQDEFDMLYLLDSTWRIDGIKESWGINNAKIIKVNPSLRYYDAYKEVLPQIEEDLILLMDNDMVVYKKGIIKKTFAQLDIQDLSVDYEQEIEQHADVVSIYDTIGEKTFPELNGKSKFCPYWFATKTALLRQYTQCEWGPVPWGETLSELTERMLQDQVRPYEWEEDKSNIYFDGIRDPKKGKNLGYYHIRAGSVAAVLLAWREQSPEEYQKYIKNQPKREYFRQLAWYHHMELETFHAVHTWDILRDLEFSQSDWVNYMNKFREYHGLV